MRIRRSCFPRRTSDILCFLLITIGVPVVGIFEVAVVLPAFHAPNEFIYKFLFAIAMFIIFNIKGNMIAVMMVDTSVDRRIRPPRDAYSRGWWHCEDCAAFAPPRSWHCTVCRTCILKSDHHCLFTGCCIGHYNHRYFVLFLIYLFIGSTLAIIYNSEYLWVLHAETYYNRLSILKMACPLLMVAHGPLWYNSHLLFYILNILAAFISISLLIYHFQPIVHGGVSIERYRGYQYNFGWKKNVESIFGKRMHLVWLSPLIKSDLPHDGMNWESPKAERRTKTRML